MRLKFTYLFLSLFILAGTIVNAQVKTVSGKVTSAEDGMGMPGVSVRVKGTSSGTTTDVNGAFVIQVPSSDAVLVFTSIGFVQKEVAVGTNTNVTVRLSADTRQLAEVTVTGLGITRQTKSLGYSAQGVTSEDLNFNHQPNLVNALQGKIAGAQITSTGGGPGQGASIRIRGVNSIDAGSSSDPLYVIDGVQIDNTTSSLGAGVAGAAGYQERTVGNRASDLNPDDIESINILKGGAATALYGLRGANGVVVITTKKGKGNGFNVSFSSSYGLDELDKIPETQTEYTSGVLGVYNDGSKGIGPAWGPTIAEAKLIDPTHPDKLFNNFERAYDTGTQIRNSISATGGSENIKYYSSISTFFQDGMMPFTDYKNLSGRLNTDITISSKFKAGTNMNFTNSGGYRYSPDRFGDGLTYWSPRWDVKNYQLPTGTQNYIGTNNPIWGAANNRLKDNVNRFIGGGNISYQPSSWLNFTYRLGLDTYNDNRVQTSPGLRGTPGEVAYDNSQGLVGEYNTNFRTINTTFIATLNHKIAGDLSGTLRLGHELYDRRYKEMSTTGTQLTIWNFYNIANAKTITGSQSLSQKRLNGIFGEATFEYKNYLFLTLTGRNDITSTLSPDKRSFFYPSASLAYTFTDQFDFPDAISNGKFRISYAKIGKDAPVYSPSSGFATYTLPSGYTGLSLSSNLGNPALRPEFTNTFEVGLAMGFLKDRVSFDVTYYNSVSKDQIVQAQVSSATGYVTTSVNAGDIRNRGIELVLSGTPVKSNDFTWDMNVNFSANRNKVLRTLNHADVVYGSAISRFYGNAGISQKLVEGESYGNIYGSYWLRYYGSAAEDPNNTDKSRPLLIGANGFPQTSGTKQKLLGNTQPKWIGGLSNNFTYKRFSLNTLIDARWGFQKYDGLEDFYAAFGLTKYTLDRRSFNVFQGVLADGTPNTKSVWMGQAVGPDGVNYGEGYYRIYYRVVSEPFVQDASWVRLRSASLSYALPAKWLPKKSIRSASVSFTGNNLWLHTNFFGLDPESTSFDAGSNIDGSAGFTYPAARTYMFTLNVGF